MNQQIYCAFFRGINIGPHKKVPMARVKELFAEFGATDISTLLNSGNVVFTKNARNEHDLEHLIEHMMEREFGFLVPTIVRSRDEVQKMINAKPFAGIEVTKDIRLYATLLQKETPPPIALPYTSDDTSYRILAADNAVVYSVLDVSKTGTTEVMNVLEKEWGKEVTTRNWNTVEKVWNIMQ